MSDSHASSPGTITSFSQLIPTLENGRLNRDLTLAMEKILAAMRAAEMDQRTATGSITLRVSFNQERGDLEVTGRMAVTEPVPPRRRTILYLEENGQLSATVPGQQEIPFNDTVDAPNNVLPLRAGIV